MMRKAASVEFVFVTLATVSHGAVFPQNMHYPIVLDSRCDGPEDTCWNDGFLNERLRDECCNTSKHGPYGKPSCWNALLGLTYLRCCCYGESAYTAHRARFTAKYRLIREVLDADELAVDAAQLTSSSFGALALPYVGHGLYGPAATTNRALLALNRRDHEIYESVIQLLLAPKQPILTHLASGWPVFALLTLYLKLFLHKTTEGAGSQVKVANSTDVALGSEVTIQQQSMCLGSCASAKAHTFKCALNCFAAASQQPQPGELGAESNRQLADSLGVALLQGGQAALMSLGVQDLCSLSPVDMLQLFRYLSAIQRKFFLQGPCTGSNMVNFLVEAEPAYKVCVSIHEKAHSLKRMFTYGRWTDCDALAAFLRKPHSIVAIDVGHNIGFCTGYLLSRGVRVIALDPVQENAEMVRSAFTGAIQTKHLKVLTKAASNVSNEPNELALDSLVGEIESPVLLKMDIESFEFEALQGATELLRTRVFGVLLDLHATALEKRGIRPWTVVEMLIASGFRVCLVVEMGAYPFKRVEVESDLDQARMVADNLVIAAYRPGILHAADPDIEFERALGSTMR
eukprot:TRINITY_DN11412_c0_g3_i1.p1 TRINITY_DN11412_c0_g3~~TRINITY_DN11412_c0_g3_i1.p1  ORF type:complete len:572 (+),score=54.14 TRINITY_DN11412_c0_g3_i1:3-1718(+)